jgi:hypothetical protein
MPNRVEEATSAAMGAIKDVKATLKGLTGVFKHLMEEHGKVSALISTPGTQGSYSDRSPRSIGTPTVMRAGGRPSIGLRSSFKSTWPRRRASISPKRKKRWAMISPSGCCRSSSRRRRRCRSRDELPRLARHRSRGRSNGTSIAHPSGLRRLDWMRDRVPTGLTRRNDVFAWREGKNDIDYVLLRPWPVGEHKSSISCFLGASRAARPSGPAVSAPKGHRSSKRTISGRCRGHVGIT